MIYRTRSQLRRRWAEPALRGASIGGGVGARLFAVAALAVGLTGCGGGGGSSASQLGRWEGPQLLSASSVEPWTYRGEPARRVRSPHYVVYTTIADDDVTAQLSQVMEGALAQYRKVAPGTARSEAPMECYVFERRVEWERYTREHTGAYANVYLQIRRGGYAIGDKFVAWYIGRIATASVAAHEGWHQYVARHFIGRLPPFVEEGLACMFEGIAWRPDGRPQWNLSINQVRVQALRKAIEGDKLWPLEKVIAMHAGEVVEEKGEKVDAFYAQAWCFAKFLYESDNGRFRPLLQKWLADTASGQVFDPTGTHKKADGPWNRTAVRPMLEHYLGMDFAAIEKLYSAYVRRVAYDEYSAQWN